MDVTPTHSRPCRCREFLSLTVATGLSVLASPTIAQGTYPTRPVRVIVPFPPAGGVDILVENIAGAGGSAGTGAAAKAAPDGYTVLFVFGSFVVNPSLFAKVPYDPFKDFQPITRSQAFKHAARHQQSPGNFGLALVFLGTAMLAGGIAYHVQFMPGLRETRARMTAEQLIHGHRAACGDRGDPPIPQLLPGA